MSVRSISIDAYNKHIKSGKALSQWMKIYEFLEDAADRGVEYTRAEIAQLTGIRLSSVCGRINELLRANLISEHGRRSCQITGEPAHTLSVAEESLYEICGGAEANEGGPVYVSDGAWVWPDGSMGEL